MGTPVILDTIILEDGTIIAAAGNPTANPVPHAFIHMGMKPVTKPTFTASIAKDITKPSKNRYIEADGKRPDARLPKSQGMRRTISTPQ
jgi:hypothetical protein